MLVGKIMRRFVGLFHLSIWVFGLPLAGSGDELGERLKLFGKPLHSTVHVPRSALETLRVELGRILYHDNRLSRDDSISCNSCHDTQAFGVDGKRFSVGFDNHLTGRNSPTSFNAFMHIAQFWDGREPTVEEQAKGPILAAGEMAMPSSDEVVKKLDGIPGYRDLFQAAFPKSEPPITYDNVGTAIGAYERLFVTPGRFDRLLAGDESALTAQEKRGLEKFVTFACTTCHVGPLVGGTMYQKLGLVKPWPNQKDQGRFDLTGKEEDRMFFKVPSLRNVAETGPWFHDGSAETLEESIRMMGRHQLGLELEEGNIADLKAFLGSLTGKLDESVAAAPKTFPGVTEEPATPDFE